MKADVPCFQPVASVDSAQGRDLSDEGHHETACPRFPLPTCQQKNKISNSETFVKLRQQVSRKFTQRAFEHCKVLKPQFLREDGKI